MKLILQRALSGSVTVEGETVGSIGPGLVVLLGISREDTPEKIQTAVNKLLSIRLWENNGKKWDSSLRDKGYELLIVSQFTLYSVLKGNKPDFHNAMNPSEAQAIYNQFVQTARDLYDPIKVQTGAFGQYMNVHIVGDGPVTIELIY
jgi:D-tyrosyl-tRNA(Tyr) deacylase